MPSQYLLSRLLRVWRFVPLKWLETSSHWIFCVCRALDDRVQMGKTFTYNYKVPARAGPGPTDGRSTAWLYHSMVDPVKGSYTGLYGAIIITDPANTKADKTPNDVDKCVATAPCSALACWLTLHRAVLLHFGQTGRQGVTA